MKRAYVFLIIILCSCHSEVQSKNICLDQENTINKQEIFIDGLDEYYVLFYLDSCLSCRNTKMFFFKKCQEIKNEVFFISLLDCNCVTSTQNNLNKTDANDIYIKFVPTVLIINKKVVIEELIGYESIVNYQNYE